MLPRQEGGEKEGQPVPTPRDATECAGENGIYLSQSPLWLAVMVIRPDDSRAAVHPVYPLIVLRPGTRCAQW